MLLVLLLSFVSSGSTVSEIWEVEAFQGIVTVFSDHKPFTEHNAVLVKPGVYKIKDATCYHNFKVFFDPRSIPYTVADAIANNSTDLVIFYRFLSSPFVREAQPVFGRLLQRNNVVMDYDLRLRSFTSTVKRKVSSHIDNLVEPLGFAVHVTGQSGPHCATQDIAFFAVLGGCLLGLVCCVVCSNKR